ncbi:hypothetical protein [Bacteroides graminisolvens]
MGKIDFDALVKEVLEINYTNFKEAGNEIKKFIESKKANYEAMAADLLDGNITKEDVEKEMISDKQAIEVILLKHAVKNDLDNEEKAKKVALMIVKIIIAAI